MLDRETIQAAADKEFGKGKMVPCDYKWGWVIYSKSCDVFFKASEVEGKIVFTKSEGR